MRNYLKYNIEHHPFGMLARSYSDSIYRFGFNTQERVPEIDKNHYTALFWEYDSRLARRWNRDSKPVAWESQYAVNRGNPILLNDPNGQTPMTAREAEIVLSAFIQAISLYAVNRAKADFETNFNYLRNSQEVEKPIGINVTVSGLRKYDDSWMRLLGTNELRTSITIVINNKILEAEVSYILSDVNGQNTITNVKDEGLVRGYFAEDRYRIRFNSKTNRDMGALEFANTKNGKSGYDAFNEVIDMIYKASYYNEAIKYDKEHGIDYNSEHSVQNYLDRIDPTYKKSYETKINIKVTGKKIKIKYLAGEKKVKIKANVKGEGK